jgi:hypothetical protein
VLAALSALAAVLGASVLVLSCAATALALALALEARYRHDLRATNASAPPHRAQLDAVVGGDARAALAPATLLALLSFAFSIEPTGAAHTARTAIGDLTIAATVVYISSLVDWYVILPRISGQLGSRPCRPGSPRFPYPHTWKEVTRWWYIHRIAGALVFRVFLALALTAVIGDLVGAGSEAQVIVGLTMGMFAAYMASIPSAVLEAAQPKVILGQTVLVNARPRRQLWPPFKRIYPPDLHGRQYVVDVSLEGVHLTEADPREGAGSPSPVEFVRHPDRLPLANLDSAKLAPRAFCGCEGRCSGINWYCIENPACFEAK